MKSALSTLGRWSLFWTLFIGIGAVGGAIGMWVNPDLMGRQELLPWMQVLPFPEVFFTSFVWPAIFLFVIIGLNQLFAASLVLARIKLAPLVVFGSGLTLIAWTIVQFVVFPLNPLTTVYFCFGLAETIMAGIWFAKERWSIANAVTKAAVDMVTGAGKTDPR